MRYRTNKALSKDGETVPFAGFSDATVGRLASKHCSIMPIRMLGFSLSILGGDAGPTMRMSHPTSAGSNTLLRISKSSFGSSIPGNQPLGTIAGDTLPERVFTSIDTMSRRMEDLAREFDCLGHFDDDDGGPRAA